MRKVLVFVLVLALNWPFLSHAQSFYALRRDRDLIVSGGTGITRYMGDLADPGEINKVRININAGVEYFLTPRISARADATWFQLSGTDAAADDSRKVRNLSFSSSNIEINLTGTFQLFPNQKKFYQRPGVNFYGFGGIGLLYFNPKTTYQGEKIALQPLQTEGVKYNRTQFVIPLGLGARLKVNPWMNVAIEGGYRETFTDYLDDVSVKEYPDPATLSSPLAVALSDRRKELNPNYNTDVSRTVRGNPNNEDSYFILTVKAQFYIPTNLSNGRKLYNSKRKAYYKKPGGMFKTKRRKPGRR
jgi:hypothetical protein